MDRDACATVSFRSALQRWSVWCTHFAFSLVDLLFSIMLHLGLDFLFAGFHPMLASIIANGRAFIKGNTAQFGGASGSVFSVLCGMQIPRLPSSKPSEFAFASDEKSIRRPTASFVRCYLYYNSIGLF